ASTVPAARTEALPVSVRRKLRSGVSIRRTQAVLPAKGPAVSSVASAPSAAAWATAAAMSSAETSMAPAASGDSLIPLFSSRRYTSQAPGVGDAPQEPPGPFVRRLAEQQSGRCLFHDLPVG